MRHSSRLLMLLGLLLGLAVVAACDSASTDKGDPTQDGDIPSDGDDGVVLDAVTIHVAADWTPYLYFSDDGGETFVTYPGPVMLAEGNGWYVLEDISRGPTGQLHFLFSDGAAPRDQARWIRPYGRTDCLDCYFVTSTEEVWILDGKMYTSRPSESDGDAPDGDDPDGDDPDGDDPDGDDPDGDDPDGDDPDGDDPDGDAPDGDDPDGDTPDGDTPDGDAPDGDDPDGDAPDGDDPDGDDPDGDDPANSFTVHLYSGWAQAYLHHSFDGNMGSPSQWTDPPGVTMTREDAQWWQVTVQIDAAVLAFVLTDGGSDWHRPFDCQDYGCYFETGLAEVWIRDGLVYPYRPVYKTYTVHLHSGWATPYLYYSVNADNPLRPLWVAAPGLLMQAGGLRSAWWQAVVEIENVHDLVFTFTNGAGDWHNPVGGGNFRSPAEQIWVRDGVLSTEAPN